MIFAIFLQLIMMMMMKREVAKKIMLKFKNQKIIILLHQILKLIIKPKTKIKII
jgi:hypothetical protein